MAEVPQGLAYWVRPALESGSELPPEVVPELERRLPEYLQAAPKPRARKQISAARDWEHLMLWIVDHFFQDATTEGWFDGILVQVRSHPRAIRTMAGYNFAAIGSTLLRSPGNNKPVQ
jgi:hypothetical protein